MTSIRSAATRAATALLIAVTGCSYVSSYVPPDSWRARPIYSGNEVIAIGTDTVVRCADELVAEDDPPVAQGPPPEPMMIDGAGYWAPPVYVHLGYYGGYYGGLHHHVSLGHALLFGHAGSMHVGHGHGAGFGNLLGGMGGLNGEAAGYLFAIVIGVGILVSSGIAVGFAAAPAESRSVPDAIDQINVHNDQMRYQIAACNDRARTAAPTEVGEAGEVGP